MKQLVVYEACRFHLVERYFVEVFLYEETFLAFLLSANYSQIKKMKLFLF